MESPEGSFHGFVADVWVNLRRGQIGMAEQFLYGADVSAALVQVGRKTVPDGARASPADTCPARKIPDHETERAAVQWPIPFVTP